MIEKYASGILHPSEVYAQFKSLDVFDQERFLQMLLDDEDFIELICKDDVYINGLKDWIKQNNNR